MSELEQRIAKYIETRFNVDSTEAERILDEAKKNVPENQQNEVIRYLAESLSSREVTTVDGINEIINTKVEEIRTTELRIQQETQKRAVKAQQIEDSYIKDINNAREEKKNAEVAEKPKSMEEILNEPIDLSPEIQNKINIMFENFDYEKFREEVEPIRKEVEQKAEKKVDETPSIKEFCDKVDMKKEMVNHVTTKGLAMELAKRFCNENGIADRKQRKDIYKAILGQTEQAEAEKVVKEKIGPAFVLTPEQKALADRLRDPASKARSLNLLSFYYDQVDIQFKKLEVAKTPEEIKQAQTDLVTYNLGIERWSINQQLLCIRELYENKEMTPAQYIAIKAGLDALDQGIQQKYNLKQRCIDQGVSIEEEKAKILADLGRGKFNTVGKGIEAEVDQLKELLEANPDLLIAFREDYFEKLIKNEMRDIEALDEKLLTADDKEREKLLKEKKADEERLEVLKQKNLTDVAEPFLKLYSQSLLKDMLDASTKALIDLDIAIDKDPIEAVKEQREQFIDSLAKSIFNSAVPKKEIELSILDAKDLSIKQRVELLTRVSKEPYKDQPKQLERIDNLHFITNAYIDAVRKNDLSGKTLSEKRKTLVYFEEFYSKDGNVLKLCRGFNKDTADQKLEELNIPEEYREFFKDLFIPICEEIPKAGVVHNLMKDTKIMFSGVERELRENAVRADKEENDRDGYVAEAFKKTFKKFKKGRSKDEVSAAMDYFHDFYSDLDKVQAFMSGINKENIDEKMVEMKVPEEARPFMKQLVLAGLKTIKPKDIVYPFSEYNESLKRTETNIRRSLQPKQDKEKGEEEVADTKETNESTDEKVEVAAEQPKATIPEKEEVPVADFVEKQATEQVAEIVEEPAVDSPKTPSKEDRKAELLRVASAIKAPAITEQSTEIRAATQELVEVAKAKSEDKTVATPEKQDEETKASPKNEGEDREE